MPPGPAEQLRLAQLRAKREHLELTMLQQLRQRGLPEPERQARIIPGRQWAWDFAWPAYWLLVEVNGGNHTGGAHSRPLGLDRDYEKANTAVLAGWKQLTFSGDQVKASQAIATLDLFFQATRYPPLVD